MKKKEVRKKDMIDSVIEEKSETDEFQKLYMESLIGIEEEKISEEEVKKLVDGLVDPAGTFYRFSLPASLLRRRRME